MGTNKDDVFIWGLDWCYREESTARVFAWGSPDFILTAETPEWVDFMENEA